MSATVTIPLQQPHLQDRLNLIHHTPIGYRRSINHQPLHQSLRNDIPANKAIRTHNLQEDGTLQQDIHPKATILPGQTTSRHRYTRTMWVETISKEANQKLAAFQNLAPMAVATPTAQSATPPRDRRNSLSSMIRLTKQMSQHSCISGRKPADTRKKSTPSQSPKLTSTSSSTRCLLKRKPLTHRRHDHVGHRSLDRRQRNQQRLRHHHARQQLLTQQNTEYRLAIRWKTGILLSHRCCYSEASLMPTRSVNGSMTGPSFTMDHQHRCPR